VRIVPAGQPQRHRLPGQEAQAVRPRCLQVQQHRVGCQRAHGTHAGDDGLRRDVLGPASLQRFQRQLAAGGGVRAGQHVALRLLGLRERVVAVHATCHLAAGDAHLAHAATAIAATVVQLQPGLHAGLQQAVAALDRELVSAGAHGDLRGNHLEHVVHHVQHVDRFGGQCTRQPVAQLVQHLGKARVGAARLGIQRAQPLAQRQHQRVVALQVALHVGQFLALVEQALRQHLLAGQRAFAQPLAESLVADLHHALQQARLLEPRLRVQRQQRLGGNEAVVELDLAGPHPLLQGAAWHAHQLRRAPDRHPMRHRPSVAPTPAPGSGAPQDMPSSPVARPVTPSR